jgi:hypothetical protein
MTTAPVIPAQAGIPGARIQQRADARACSRTLHETKAGDSRLRGNDGITP